MPLPIYNRGGANTGLMDPSLMSQVLQQLQSRNNFVNSRVAGPAASPQVPPSVPPGISPLAPAWPTFNNEAERNIALHTGAYDPTYISPLKRTEALAMETGRAADMERASIAARASMPLDPNAPDAQIMAAQTAGDFRGDARRVMHSLHGLDYEGTVGSGAALPAYRPRTGFGGLPTEDAITSRLDLDLVSDPEFQRLTAQDPKRAAFVYENLTGRPYVGDVKLHDKIRGEQATFGINTVRKEIEAGAYREPATGKWMVWETREAPEGGLGVSNTVNAPKPFRQLVEANETKQRLMDTYFTRATGMQVPPTVTGTRGQKFGAQHYLQDPAVAAAVAAAEKALHRKLTPQETLREAQRALANPPIPLGDKVMAEAERAAQFADPRPMWEDIKSAGRTLQDVGGMLPNIPRGVGNLWEMLRPTGAP